jgi:hypothetical protein
LEMVTRVTPDLVGHIHVDHPQVGITRSQTTVQGSRFWRVYRLDFQMRNGKVGKKGKRKMSTAKAAEWQQKVGDRSEALGCD